RCGCAPSTSRRPVAALPRAAIARRPPCRAVVARHLIYSRYLLRRRPRRCCARLLLTSMMPADATSGSRIRHMMYRPQGDLATAPGLEVISPRFAYRSVAPNEPQLFVDDYLVDNRFNEDLLSARVPHVLHPPRRPDAPILSPDESHPWERGCLT